jgi:hypothetical protein
LFACDVPELRHEGEERAARDGPHALDGPQSFLSRFEFRQ